MLLIGDNFGDFVSDVDQSLEARQELAERYTSLWGTGWIVLANPQYGSWEGALFDFDYSLTRPEQLRQKKTRLQTKR